MLKRVGCDERCAGASGGLPYERYRKQGQLTYERKPALTYQAFNNHACPDSPGSLHARVSEYLMIICMHVQVEILVWDELQINAS